jgi:cyclopropane fatty-acyl-phospholipid synthase-like methyltransferase
MVINAPYYKSDTITRILKTFERDQKISLQPNDYALIIHYFSEMNVDDWQKRRSYLDKFIDDGAMIYQVLNDINAPGMELYNKDEFIDKLTMPTGSLKHIEILDTKFKDDKIMVLRFRINEK